MTATLEERSCDLLLELGLASANESIEVVPLRGGVASDIARVTVGNRTYCVKFALEKLKVKENWRVPTHRNKAEFAWLEFAATVAPSSVPRLYGQSGIGFAMEYCASPDVRLWKDALLREAPKIRHARSVATVLGRIHRTSTRSGFCRKKFRNYNDFLAIRIEPYLYFTASKHPSLARRLEGIGEGLHRSRIALVHGDISPKNILFRNNRPILLDAECATIGDPAFDVSFCLNHLVLKSVHRPQCGKDLIAAGIGFWSAYASYIDWEPREDFEARAAELLPALMLARIDGKSPVEYLSQRKQDRVRRMAISLILESPAKIAEVFAAVQQAEIDEDE